MKRILLYILFVFMATSFAQNPKLSEKTWFVESLSIAGAPITIPYDSYSFPYTSINFLIGSNSSLITTSNKSMVSNCSIGFTAHATYTNQGNVNTSFQFTDITPFNTTTNCQTTDNAMIGFMQSYQNFFLDGASGVFSYSILDVYGIDHLIIEKDNGDVIWFTEIINPVVMNDLFANNWTLSKLVIDGTDYITPDFSSQGIDNISLQVYNYYAENIATGEHRIDIEQTFSLSACDYLTGMIDVYPNDNQFFIYDYVMTLGSCGMSELTAFSNQYLNFYVNNLPGAFSYNIQTNNGVQELTVTNTLGNQAVYNRSVLSVDENNFEAISLYPNPVKDVLHITSDANLQHSIFNVLGQKIVSFTQNEFDVSSLENGMYILQSKDKNNTIKTHKFIKTN